MVRLKEKIKNKEKLIGTHVTIGEPCVAEAMGYLGFDFLWIDMEHTSFGCQDLYNLLNAAKAAGTNSIVRVPQHDYTILKKVLEMGPDGIIFPMITDVEQAKEDIEHSVYPPYGIRGFGPKRAIRYGLDDALQYIEHNALENMCRFVQIEHIEMIKHLEEYFKIPYIDGFIIGPCDLAGSIGKPGRQMEEETSKLIRDTVDFLKRNNKYTGISYGDYSAEGIEHWSNMGIDMISVGSEMDYIVHGAQTALKNLKKVHLKETNS